VANNEAKIRLTAEDATSAAFAAVTRNVGNLKTELATLPARFTQIAIASAGIGSIAGFSSMISAVIEGRAKLRDLSMQSNISVEALSSLGKVARYADTPLEDVANASTKLSKALFTQNEDSKGAAAAIRALGLDFEKFKNLTPDQQMYEVAKALDRFQDGSEKSAAAMLLFGKQGAQLLPFLKELAERGLDVAKVTTKQAEEAKKYEDNLRALAAAGEEWKKTLASDMLPTLLEFSRELVAGRQAYGSWIGAIVGIGSSDPTKTLGENIRSVRDEVHGLEDELRRSQSGTIRERLSTRPTDVITKELTSAQQRYDYFKRLQAMQALDLGSGVYDDPRIAVRKGKLELPNANNNDALLRKVFQGQLKLIKDELEQQKDAYDFANKYLKNVYDDGLTSLSDYFEKQRAIRDQGVSAELAAIAKEIAAAEKLKASADKAETRQQAENTIAEAVVKRSLIVQKAAEGDILALQEEAKAAKQLANSYYDFLASVEALRGNNEGSFELGLAKRQQDAQDQFTKVGFSAAEAREKAAAYASLLRNVDALSRAQSDYGRVVESVSTTEKTIQLDAQLAGTGELDVLRQLAAERQKQLPLLQTLAERAQAQALAIGSPDALLAAQKLTLQFRLAQAEADPVFMKIRDIGKEMGEAVANDAEAAILHWEGARKLLLAIEQDILRIATRKLFTEPFGNWLSNQVGGNGTASGGGGLLGGLLSRFGLGAGGGVNFGSSGASIDAAASSFAGWYADGGTLQPGEWGMAGENGPEPIFAGSTPLHVMPNGRGGQSIVIQQSFAPGTNRATIDQAALAAGQAVSRASRRNG
jgi:hypothetical protein